MLNGKGGTKGLTLIEAIISILITAIAITAIFAVSMSTHTSDKKLDKQQEAMLVMKRVSEQLKAFVTADSGAEASVRPASQTVCGDASPLSAGTHNIDSCLSGTILQGGTLSYTVTNEACGSETCQKVAFSITYPD